MPLYHLATSSLPTSTIAPGLEITNTTSALVKDSQVFSTPDLSRGGYVDEKIMGRYLGYLVGIGFLEPPKGEGKERLKVIEVSEEQRNALLRVGGRGALV